MPKNPFETQLRKEEALYSKQIAKIVDKALADRKTVKRAQPLAKEDGKGAPKVTRAMYFAAAHKAIEKLRKKYPAMQMRVDLNYKKTKGNWHATSVVTATYIMKKVGGASHLVKPSETLWSISEKYYGSGVFWAVLEGYNPAARSKSAHLRAGIKLHVPQIEVIDKICVPATVERGGSAPKGAKKPAVHICYPNVVLKFSKTKTVEHAIVTPWATMKLSLSISGAISVSKPGVIPMNFDVRKHTASISSASEHFTSSFSISSFKDASFSVSNKVSGNQWKTSFTIKPNGTISVSIAPQSVSFRHKGLDYAGKIGVTLEITYIIHYVPEKRSVWEEYGDWISDHQKELIISFAALPVAAAAVTSTAASATAAGAIKWGTSGAVALLAN